MPCCSAWGNSTSCAYVPKKHACSLGSQSGKLAAHWELVGNVDEKGLLLLLLFGMNELPQLSQFMTVGSCIAPQLQQAMLVAAGKV